MLSSPHEIVRSDGGLHLSRWYAVLEKLHVAGIAVTTERGDIQVNDVEITVIVFHDVERAERQFMARAKTEHIIEKCTRRAIISTNERGARNRILYIVAGPLLLGAVHAPHERAADAFED